MSMIDRTKLKPIDTIENEEVRVFADRAKRFLLSHKWCEEITAGYLAYGSAGIIGIFLFDIVSSQSNVDEPLWVLTGDLPPAYLVTDEANSWQEALDCYVEEMRRWVEAVRNHESIEEIIPVNAPPTLEYARMLESRLDTLQEFFLDVPIDSVEEGDS